MTSSPFHPCPFYFSSIYLYVIKERFFLRGQGDVPGVKYEISDYSKKLPEGTPDLVLSALSIHHLEHEKKKSLFKSIHNSLSEGGTFLNYDQFCCENDTLNTKTEEYWIEGIKNSGLSEKEFDRWLERKKLDRECSVAQEIAWLKEAGFKSAECIYLMGKFAIILAEK